MKSLLLSCSLFLACGAGFNDHIQAQKAACNLAPNNGCIEFVGQINVTVVTDVELTNICKTPIAAACYVDGEIFVQAEFERCDIIAHEFLHAIGDQFEGDSDHRHKRLPFNQTQPACKEVQ